MVVPRAAAGYARQLKIKYDIWGLKVQENHDLTFSYMI